MSNPKIPEGYRINAAGHLVPESMIRPVDLERDALVTELVKSAICERERLSDFKATTFERLEEFLAAVAKKYKVKLDGAKGNFTLVSYDGRYKITVQRANRVAFNESLQIAAQLVQECVQGWTASIDNPAKLLAQDAFNPDQEGKVSLRKVLDLRRHKIDDPKWKRAMEAINQSIQVVGSKDYVRFFERDERGGYQPISLDLANV